MTGHTVAAAVLLVLSLVTAAAVISASVPDPAPTPLRPAILSVTGCARQYRQWSIDCSGGERLTVILTNFSWIDWAMVTSETTSNNYLCSNVQVLNESAITCIAPTVAQADIGHILSFVVHDQIADTESHPLLAVEYNATRTSPSEADSGSHPCDSTNDYDADDYTRPSSPPSFINASGCARQYGNWTIDCAGGELLTLTFANFSWIDNVTFLSPKSGEMYYCTDIQPESMSSVTCIAPHVAGIEIGHLLQVYAHDGVSDWDSELAFAIEYNSTGSDWQREPQQSSL